MACHFHIVSLILAEATGLGICFVVINPCVLSANRVDLDFFLFHKFSHSTSLAHTNLRVDNGSIDLIRASYPPRSLPNLNNRWEWWFYNIHLSCFDILPNICSLSQKPSAPLIYHRFPVVKMTLWSFPQPERSVKGHMIPSWTPRNMKLWLWVCRGDMVGILGELLLYYYPISSCSTMVLTASARYYNSISRFSVMVWTASVR